MNVAAILSDDYRGILEVAVVSDIHTFDGRAEYDFFFDETLVSATVVWEEGDYAIADVGYDDPTLMLFYRGGPVGFYFELMCWVDEDHRGKGLATQLVLQYADTFGEDCFVRLRRKAGCAMGFSPAGFALHERALEVAGTIMGNTQRMTEPTPNP